MTGRLWSPHLFQSRVIKARFFQRHQLLVSAPKRRSISMVQRLEVLQREINQILEITPRRDHLSLRLECIKETFMLIISRLEEVTCHQAWLSRTIQDVTYQLPMQQLAKVQLQALSHLCFIVPRTRPPKDTIWHERKAVPLKRLMEADARLKQLLARSRSLKSP